MFQSISFLTTMLIQILVNAMTEQLSYIVQKYDGMIDYN